MKRRKKEIIYFEVRKKDKKRWSCLTWRWEGKREKQNEKEEKKDNIFTTGHSEM